MTEVKRSANFTAKEEGVLLCLVRKYKAILENKKTDSNNNKKKLECWQAIEREFNNECGQVFRDYVTLRKKYENLKKRTKKKFADEKCHALGTGGGPSRRAPEITDIDLEIKDILAERIDGLPSEFGGDAGGDDF
nr:unnamed protein product [Callosobruchus chinensis]CAH7735379.1 unnamed protein product [Callosobruchus chinensis]CAH7741787.1 unnamed protein product [Callosobruchus chinensis]